MPAVCVVRLWDHLSPICLNGALYVRLLSTVMVVSATYVGTMELTRLTM